MDLISIIIPVYNSEKYLKECLHNVARQTYTNIEVILVDDASTDSSGQICDEMVKADERFKAIHHDENRGLSVSKHDGYLLTTGEWISFVDNDDLISFSTYEDLIRLSKEYTDAEVICIAAENADDTDITARFIELNKAENNNLKYKNKKYNNVIACRMMYSSVPKELRVKGIFGPTWGKIYKREIFEKTLSETIKYRESLPWMFMEDVLFVPLCMSMACNVVFTDKVDYLHRISNINLSSSLKPSEFHYESVYGSVETLEWYKNNGMGDIACGMLEDVLLNMQSVWYKVFRYEEDAVKRKNEISRMNLIFSKYYKEYMQSKNNKKNFIHLASVLLFALNKKVWIHIVGDFYFKRQLTLAKK